MGCIQSITCKARIRRENIVVYDVCATIDQCPTRIEETSPIVLRYKTPYFKASARVVMPPIPRHETWVVGWIQACNQMEFFNTYSDLGMSPCGTRPAQKRSCLAEAAEETSDGRCSRRSSPGRLAPPGRARRPACLPRLRPVTSPSCPASAWLLRSYVEVELRIFLFVETLGPSRPQGSLRGPQAGRPGLPLPASPPARPGRKQLTCLPSSSLLCWLASIHMLLDSQGQRSFLLPWPGWAFG
ncbi:protein FAM78B isoform X2 [Sciurus carolinensis]|uniref:protein FAM78B isoform X2 n=1 Tax=Sciurus carolinensis TaxID=30640 RepID=UPI001FB352D0|nr:protein FAM78B isoform X2 [Sciurus carolinensis]